MTTISNPSPKRYHKPYKEPYKGIVPSGKKYCPDCETIQDIALFTSKTGKAYVYCKDCRNSRSRARYEQESAMHMYLLRTYGLTKEVYQAMLAEQGGVCACCGEPEKLINAYTGKVQRLCVDHHHASGQVRKLLCDACNKLVGHIEGDISRVEKAVAYLAEVQES